MIRLVVSDNDMISLSTVVIRDDEVIPHMKDRRCKRSSYALSSTQLWDSHGILLSSQGISNHCFPHPSNIHWTANGRFFASISIGVWDESSSLDQSTGTGTGQRFSTMWSTRYALCACCLEKTSEKCLEQRMGLIPLFDQSIDWSNFNAT